MGEGADSARELPDSDGVPGGDEARAVALHLGIPEGELHPEGHGLRVDAVGAADHDGALVVSSAGLEHA